MKQRLCPVHPIPARPRASIIRPPPATRAFVAHLNVAVPLAVVSAQIVAARMVDRAIAAAAALDGIREQVAKGLLHGNVLFRCHVCCFPTLRPVIVVGIQEAPAQAPVEVRQHVHVVQQPVAVQGPCTARALDGAVPLTSFHLALIAAGILVEAALHVSGNAILAQVMRRGTC